MRTEQIRFAKWFKSIILFMVVLLLSDVKGYAQSSGTSGVNELIGIIKKNTEKFPVEKIHLHLDKPWYSVGDTLWFKAYLFDAAFLTAASKSGLIYIEIADDSSKLVKRMLLAAAPGLSWGNIALTEKDFPSGAYTIKAYTKWMFNFGQDYIFKRKFYVTDVARKSWLVSLRKNVIQEEGKQKAVLDFRLTTTSGVALSTRPVLLKVYDRGRITDRDNITTDIRGDFAVKFPLPARNLNGKLAVSVENDQQNATKRKLIMPLLLDRHEYTDLQFMPESGNLISGVSTRIGFKAIGENGKGKEVSGTIIDQSGREITRFSSAHKGMGYFSLQPFTGEKYTAVVTFSDSSKKTYPFPLVMSSGISFSVTNDPKQDSIRIDFFETEDIYSPKTKYYFVAQSRGIPCWGASFFVNQPGTRLIIPKNVLPTGITRLSLLTTGFRPVCERMVFVNNKEQLRIDVNAGKADFMKRDSINLDVLVTNQLGNPVRASLSVSITDDGQIKPDENNDNSIISNMLLCSDLKGIVEEPGYYFKADSTGKIASDLDNLLLTQGWIGYDWPSLFNPERKPGFSPEREYVVRGVVRNIFNTPVKNTSVVMFSKNPVIVMNTRTNDSGNFVFNEFPTSDTASFMLQARNKNGKSFNVGIDVDEFKPPFISNPEEISLPWFMNIDTSRLKTLNRLVTLQEEQSNLTGKSEMLEEVFVIGKKVIPDSKNLNGPGESDFVMNAADLNKAGKVTLRQLLEKNVKGFRLGGKKLDIWMIDFSALHLIIDGINVDDFKTADTSTYEFYRFFLDFFTADDIKGIELLKSGKYTMKYTTKFINDTIPFSSLAFVEVTTYGGQGPFLKKLPGVYLFRPIPLAVPAKFYAPKYVGDTTVDPIAGTDIRSTIHWEPNLVTDINGKAKLSFFAADYGGTYTIIVQGADMNGGIGQSRRSIRIRE